MARRRRLSITRVIVSLCTAICAFGVILAAEIYYLSRPVSPADQSIDLSQKYVIDKVQQSKPKDLNTFLDVTRRTLFAEDRGHPITRASASPVTAGVAATKTALPSPALTMSLVAVMVSPNERIALIQSPANTTTTKLRVGETIDGWTVLSIEADHIQLKALQTEQTLFLRDVKSRANSTGGTNARSETISPQD